MKYEEIKSSLKPWQWCECMQDGTVVQVVDGRVRMPIYDSTTEAEAKEIEAYYTKISEQYSFTSEELK